MSTSDELSATPDELTGLPDDELAGAVFPLKLKVQAYLPDGRNPSAIDIFVYDPNVDVDVRFIDGVLDAVTRMCREPGGPAAADPMFTVTSPGVARNTGGHL